METVSRVINTASNAIWGEGSQQQTTGQEHDEPISGVQGAGAATDPYDAGNREGKSFHNTSSFMILPILLILKHHHPHHDDIPLSTMYFSLYTL